MDPLKKKRTSTKIDCEKVSRPSSSITTPKHNGDTQNSSRTFQFTDQDVNKLIREFSELSNFLNSTADPKALKSVEISKIKEALNRVTVIVQEWKAYPPEIQEQFSREDLLSKVVPLISHDNTSLKFRVIRTSLSIMRSVGFVESMSNSTASSLTLDKYEPESSFVKYSDQEESGQKTTELFLVLKSLAKLSKEAQNDILFVQEGLYPFLMEIVVSIVNSQEEYLNPLVLLLNTIKNISGNEEIRKKALEVKNCTVFSNLLNYLNEISKNEKKTREEVYKVIYQLTACLRNFATDPSCIEAYSASGVLNRLFDAIELNLQESELVLNCLRIISKLSLNRDCCNKIVEDKQKIVLLMKILKIHRNGLSIVVRICFILGNITTYIEQMREYLYFDLKIFPQLLECFNFYLTKGNDMSRAQEMEKAMRSSFAKFDKTSAAESYLDAIMKLVRLMANLFTLDKIGLDFVIKYGKEYKYLLRHICVKIKDKDVESNTELLVAGLSFLANVMFYEKQTIGQEDFELKTLKTEILFTLSRFIIQKDNEEVCCEALRVLSNLSRDKTLAKQITKTKLVDAVIALLEHTNKDIVYYSLGIVMNLMVTEEMRKVTILQTILSSVTNILFYSTIEDLDIVSCCLKCSTNVLDSLDKPDIDGNILKTLEELIVNFGEQCDVVMSGNQKHAEADGVGDLRGIINHLLNIMPEQSYNCPEANCGRRFKSEDELKVHLTRRHKK